MKNRTIRIAIAGVAVAGLMLAAVMRFGPGTSAGNVSASSGRHMNAIQKRILSGFADNTLEQQNKGDPPQSHLTYFPDRGDDQCANQIGSNIKVNQNCLNLSDFDLQGRGQANNETAIAVNPNNPSDLVAGSNDYRRGDGTCGSAYTLDDANHWNDSTIPNGFTRAMPTFSTVAERQYWEASGDPSVAWDTKGNAYYDCMVFNRGFPTTTNPDQSSGIYVFRSTQNNGASWNFPGRPVAEQLNPGPSEVPLLDKPYMTVDNHKGSPFQDRIYVTWTLFSADGSAIIYEAHSNDYGETFSAPVLVSKSSPLCTITFGVPTTVSTCNENQDSQPFTGPDGALYVVYSNFNNSLSGPKDNHNQMLLVKSTNGGKTFSAPVLVGNFYDLPDCATYQGGQDLGRACVPEKGKSRNSVFRANNYSSGAVNPTNKNQVVITFGSYINKHSNESNGCVPEGISTITGQDLYKGVKTPGACNNDILVSVSSNGGKTFTGTTTDPRQLASVNTAPKQATTDQFWQWAAFSNSGRFEVSYYDRQYGNDEFNGNMDISLSGSPRNDVNNFTVLRVTSGSMPLPTEFPDEPQGNSLFFGDYSGLDVSGNTAYPIWMDTRDKDLILCPGTGAPGVPPQVCRFIAGTNGIVANDEDIYMAKVAVP